MGQKKIVLGESVSHLAAMQSDVTGADFVRYFGEVKGLHLWQKFVGASRYNILILWQLADSETKDAILSFITQWERKQ